MKDKVKTKKQLVAELAQMRQRIAELEAAEAERLSAEQAGKQEEEKEEEETLRRRADELAALQATVLDITTPHDLPTLLQTIVERAVRLLNALGGGLYLCDPNREEARCVVSYNTPRDFTGIVLKYGEGAAGTVAQTGEPLVIDDYRIWSDRASVYEDKRPFTAVLSAPMIWQGQVTGVIRVLHDMESRRFTQADLELLTLFADHAAIAVENTQLYEQTQREIAERKRAEEQVRQRALEQETVCRIARALNTPDIRDVFPTLVEGLRNLTACDRVSLTLLGEGGEHFRTAILESPFPVLEEGTVMSPSSSSAVKGLAIGRPHLTTNLSTETDFPGEQALYQAGFRSRVNLPLLAGGEIIGALNLGSRQPGRFREDQLPVLQQIADALASAVENSRLFRAEQGQRKLAEALEKAAAAVSGTLNFEQVLDRILEQVEQVVAGDAFNVMLVEENHARTVRWRGYERFGMDTEEFLSTVVFCVHETPTLQQMVETGEPVIVPDTSADSKWANLPALEWLRSYIAAPIQVSGLTVGFLNVDGVRPDQFGPADARRLEAFASHAATAIENAKLHQELQAHAGQLEQRVQERTAELQAQYAWLDAILDSTTDGIVVTNAEGSIVQANPVAQAWLTQTLSPKEAGQLREAIRSVVTRMEEQPVELLELTGLDLELSAAMVVEEGAEKPTAAVVDIHDVTHLKALDRMKTHFITNISHELRTPIATIKLYAYLMGQHPKKWEQYLDVLVQEADHQARLVNDILEISRIDAGRLEMKPCSTPLNELTEATVVRYRVLAQEQGVTLEYRLAESGLVMLADPERMMQVLSNLVGNAIRYTPEGGKVVVSTGAQEAEGRTWATVTVADMGMGIPEKELPHIFERFFRGEKPRSMQLTGTGLGLAIVKEIVELHGGRVTVQSQVDVGSTFTVWLPLSD